MCATSVLSTAFREPLRLFLFASITASALCLLSCGSAKTAVRSEVKQQQSTDVQTGVTLELTSREQSPVTESPELTLPVSALSSLPEGAEFSRQDGNTRVSARRTKGDSVQIQATSLRTPAPQIDMKVGAAANVETSDSIGSESSAKAHLNQPLARGQPDRDNSSLLLLLILALAACWICIHKRSD